MSLLRRRRADDGLDPAAIDPAITPIGEVAGRQRVRVSGQVVRMRARPTSGLPALVLSISDETGTATAVWTGRRSIGGVTLGRRLTIEGVPLRRGDQLEFTNPVYTLLPRS